MAGTLTSTPLGSATGEGAATDLPDFTTAAYKDAYSRINAIVKGRRTISADTDLRLCRFFTLSEGFWLRMQASHDLKLATQALGGVLHSLEPFQPT